MNTNQIKNNNNDNKKVILINYADRRYYNSQRKNSQTGKNIGKFDRVIAYSRKHLDINFQKKNRLILNNNRGAGYWIWKPYIILKTLNQLNDGDYLFYCDSGSYFIHSIRPLVDILEKSGQPIMCFQLNHIEKVWTKRDTFILLGCDKPEFYNSKQRLGGFQLVKKCPESIKFYQEYLKFAQDRRCITDLPNQLRKPNYPGFRDHRHDQSIFSLLTKKYGYQCYRDPSQFGGKHKPGDKNILYPQIIQLTRDKR